MATMEAIEVVEIVAEEVQEVIMKIVVRVMMVVGTFSKP